MSEEARVEAREEFVWNMHTDYTGVAHEAFDGGYDAGVAEGIRQAREAADLVRAVHEGEYFAPNLGPLREAIAALDALSPGGER